MLFKLTIATLALALLSSFTSGQNVSPVAATFRQKASASSLNIGNVESQTQFDALISAKRDYSISMLLSAIDSAPVECGPCKLFQPTYQGIAKAARRISSKTDHVFAYLEFKNGREVFQKLGLQYAPALLYYPPNVGPRASPVKDPEQYDFNRLGFDGEEVVNDISKRIGAKIPYSKPFPWTLVGIISGSTLGTIAILSFILPRIAKNIGGITASSLVITLFKAIILATITIMCSGHMWNSIRSAPFITADSSGKPQYFASGFQNQNGAETQIVAVIYGILAFSIVSLSVLVPSQRDPVKQRAGVYVWSAIMLSAFSLLLYIFRLKNPSYPFRLFF